MATLVSNHSFKVGDEVYQTDYYDDRLFLTKGVIINLNSHSASVEFRNYVFKDVDSSQEESGSRTGWSITYDCLIHAKEAELPAADDLDNWD